MGPKGWSVCPWQVFASLVLCNTLGYWGHSLVKKVMNWRENSPWCIKFENFFSLGHSMTNDNLKKLAALLGMDHT